MLRTISCSTVFSTQSGWAFHFNQTKLVWLKKICSLAVVWNSVRLGTRNLELQIILSGVDGSHMYEVSRIRRLEHFEARDPCFGESDARPTPLVTGSGVTRHEVSRISNAWTHKGQRELWVEWKGCHHLLHRGGCASLGAAFDTRPSTFTTRASATQAHHYWLQVYGTSGKPMACISTRIRGVAWLHVWLVVGGVASKFLVGVRS